MRCVAALLAAALLAIASGGCGDGGAEPGAPVGATLMLDFTPNAVHSGIYAAKAAGDYADAGIDLTIREPGESTDAPKLLAAGRVDFAVMDIHDLAIARQRGIDVVGIFPLVQAPLASLIVRADGPIGRPRDLAGHTVGVTGLPSDEAVVDSEVAADGADPDDVARVTIGFNAVSALAADRVDAVTGFWNAEGVALRRRNVPVRIFKVDRYGAPRYPELFLVTSARTVADDPELVAGMFEATRGGYRFTAAHPGAAIDDLVAAVPGLERSEQAAQMRVLRAALTPAPIRQGALSAWAAWDLRHGIVQRPIDVFSAFANPPSAGS